MNCTFQITGSSCVTDLFIFLVLLFLRVSLHYCQEDFSMEDALEYPIIVNLEVDKAVFIVPHKGCHVVTDSQLTKAVLYQRRLNIFKEDGKTVDEIIQLCEQYQNSSIDGTQLLVGIRNRALLIYPGTKWCGVGSSALNYTDLGYYNDSDSCCRDHDYCDDYVIGYTCHDTNGLCNKSPFTRSHCECDDKLRQCLERSSDEASRMIGVLFFTVFGLQCFREDYPIISCLEYGGFLNIHCQKYLLDYEQEKIYQFFDSPRFLAKSMMEESSNEPGNETDKASNGNIIEQQNLTIAI